MIKLCTVKEIRSAERAVIEAGRSENDLMLEAGNGFAEVVLKHHGRGTGTALFFIGPGNNGGDGLVAASRLVADGWICKIVMFQRDGIGSVPIKDSLDTFDLISSDADLDAALLESDLIVDAVYGTGGRAELPDVVGQAFDKAHQVRIDRGTPLWAVDVPSGVDSDSGAAADRAFRADVTVSFGLPKIGLYRAPALRNAGTIHLVDIGLDSPPLESGQVGIIDESSVRRLMPRRKQDSHKHEVGWLMVVGGAPNYFGAPRMAAESAARAGAGLVCLAVPRSLVVPISSAVREVTFLPLPEAEFGGAGDRMANLIHEKLPSYAAMLIGPGLGLDDPVPEFLSALFGMRSAVRSIGFGSIPASSSVDGGPFSGSAVVDADGLNWLARQVDWQDSLRDAKLVLTPHPGELSRLTGKSVEEITGDPWTAARDAAERFEQVVVLKHAHPIVAAPGRPLVVGPSSEPALASAGTGDVLAGTIAGLLAQGLSAYDAAVAGVFVGSVAAEIAVGRVGTLSLIAGDVIEALPAAVRSLYDRRW